MREGWWRRWVIGLVLLSLLAIGVVSYTLWYKLFRNVDQPPFANTEELFKYGSIGNENNSGLPYWIWLVLPKMFPQYLPGVGAYPSFGFSWEQGQPLPVGLSNKTIGFPRVTFNCALCHTARYRLHEGEPPVLVAGGPAHTVNIQAYQNFLTRAAKDAKFNASAILHEIGLIYDLSWLDRLLYRFAIIPAARRAMIRFGESQSWMDAPVEGGVDRPEWGRGRIDPFNPVKFGILEMNTDITIGNSVMVPLWNMRARQGKALHWDGLNTNLRDVVVSSAVGDGMDYKGYENGARKTLDEIQKWLLDLPAPQSPFVTGKAGPGYELDQEQVKVGEAIFRANCAVCHAKDGQRNGTVIPVEEVGTDRHRVDMWTAEAAQRYNAYQADYDWGFEGFRDLNGYVAIYLDGVWLRGPYLHNGSVPTLRDLLRKPEDRPKLFYRGHDVYDPVNVGFISQGKQAEAVGSRHDVSLPGNSNQGHLFGTELTESDKLALLSYLKTL